MRRGGTKLRLGRPATAKKLSAAAYKVRNAKAVSTELSDGVAGAWMGHLFRPFNDYVRLPTQAKKEAAPGIKTDLANLLETI